MKVLGIDPGTLHLGYGLIEDGEDGPHARDYGTLDFKSSLPVEERLFQIHSLPYEYDCHVSARRDSH